MWIYVVIAFPLLMLSMVGYLKLASHFGIVDRPNARSSHQSDIIRGGGIVFYLALVYFELTSGFRYPYLFLGLSLIALISFLDDLSPLSNKIRISAHFVAVSMLLYQLGLLGSPWYVLMVVFILSIGTINAYNFMDGINGITGVYSLGLIITFIVINQFMMIFVEKDLLFLILVSLLVFGYFNFRVKAKCFAGDVGSIGIAFVITFLVIKLILITKNWSFILLLAVYGVDSVLTILHRLLRRENIFMAHRSHLYQHLANNKGIPHLVVSAVYGVVQLIVSGIVIYNYQYWGLSYLHLVAITLLPLSIGYVLLKVLYVPTDPINQL